MFRAVLRTQWKWTRVAVLVCLVLAFAMPLVSLRSATMARSPQELISAMAAWGIGYATLAASLGLIVAWLAWASDHRGHHVYALALPVPRWRYVLLRFAAGVVLLLPVVVALGVGTALAVAVTNVPTGLHTYAVAVCLRFAFAALVSFAIFFAISAMTARAASYILGAIVVVLVAEFTTDAVGLHWQVGSHVLDFLIAYPGILSVFNGRWMLIDV